MTYLEEQADLLKYLSKREKLEYIIELGESHKRLDPQDQTEENLVPGCQSKAWLLLNTDEKKIRIDADSLIVRGYLHLVEKAVNEANNVEEAEENIKQFVVKTSLEETMTPTRSNAIPTVLEKVKKEL